MVKQMWLFLRETRTGQKICPNDGNGDMASQGGGRSWEKGELVPWAGCRPAVCQTSPATAEQGLQTVPPYPCDTVSHPCDGHSGLSEVQLLSGYITLSRNRQPKTNTFSAMLPIWLQSWETKMHFFCFLQYTCFYVFGLKSKLRFYVYLASLSACVSKQVHTKAHYVFVALWSWN